jgi:hypothetical protein
MSPEQVTHLLLITQQPNAISSYFEFKRVKMFTPMPDLSQSSAPD